jgi:energy-coupling factor transporter transmembrane protein EcfT
MGKRIAYGLLGFAFGALIVTALFAIRSPHHWGFAITPAIALCISCGTVVTWMAERNGKVKSIEELHRPLKLFPRATDGHSS